ncbi:MAG: hypothetical protein AB1758_26885 [Candidatus Eremiobacterota bacterium]
MVSVGVYAALLAIVAALFIGSVSLWRRVSSKDSADREMGKARLALQRDLAMASPAQLSRARVPPSLGAGDDGEALWFLSPVDPASGQMAHRQDGTPCWQRNILYYLVVPDNHQPTFGMVCNGGTGPTGYDDRCSHKVLIRKVIDTGPATIPTDETTQEALIVNINPYLTRPNGYSLAAMAGEPGLGEAKIVASQLLVFETTAGKPGELNVDLRAVTIDAARRQIPLGSASCFTGPFTRQGPFSAFLHN